MEDNEDVMTRDETFKMVNSLMAAVLMGEPPPTDLWNGKNYLVAEDFEDALDGVARLISDQFNGIGAKVTEDFEMQETIQQKTDEMVAGIVLLIRQQCGQLRQR